MNTDTQQVEQLLNDLAEEQLPYRAGVSEDEVNWWRMVFISGVQWAMANRESEKDRIVELEQESDWQNDYSENLSEKLKEARELLTEIFDHPEAGMEYWRTRIKDMLKEPTLQKEPCPMCNDLPFIDCDECKPKDEAREAYKRYFNNLDENQIHINGWEDWFNAGFSAALKQSKQ
jgi:hypothetical protein